MGISGSDTLQYIDTQSEADDFLDDISGIREIAVDTWEHYDEHAVQVRAWRQRVGL